MDHGAAAGFEAFVNGLRPKLSRAFAAAFGAERGQEALAEALAYAWEHYESLTEMVNPGGYLFRVGQSRTRRRRGRTHFADPRVERLPEVEPELVSALAELSERQRACVVLVHGYDWTYQEVADLLGVSRSSVQNHVERGLRRLRGAIGAVSDA